MRKLFLLALLPGLLTAATDALAKKQHRHRAQQAPVSRSAPPAVHASHPGGGSNSK